ncbi:hypothetical protein GLW08_20440 [Pontibacillus yanchengensis]|uniref:Uncharacterized protein n=2 Tax=Pontibacillus yanchengensis TaxID=462910 RepID=A0ACC7VMK9_9BACI|nr:helix-turn-helix transcriptional regulator [Pontibacillus yanchengensis]MYL35474.1 hypothetical protein [Pontibacillus yanchengensis]MYL55674.1 hypothetical protein [Pontibacillus yanchengensis]
MENIDDRLMPIFIPSTKGECLSYFRKVLTLTQMDVAKTCEIERSSISKMENGDIEVHVVAWNFITHQVYTTLEIKSNGISYQDFNRFLNKLYEQESVSL